MPVCNSETDLKETFDFLRDQGNLFQILFCILKTYGNAFTGTVLYNSDYWKRQLLCIDLQWFCDVAAKIVCIPVRNGKWMCFFPNIACTRLYLHE